MQRHRLLGTFCGELLDCDIIEVERKGLPALREIWLSAPQGRLWFFLSFLLASVVICWLCCEGVRIEWMHLWIFLLWCSVKITKLCRRMHDPVNWAKYHVYKLLLNPRTWDNWGHFLYLFLLCWIKGKSLWNHCTAAVVLKHMSNKWFPCFYSIFNALSWCNLYKC